MTLRLPRMIACNGHVQFEVRTRYLVPDQERRSRTASQWWSERGDRYMCTAKEPTCTTNDCHAV